MRVIFAAKSSRGDEELGFKRSLYSAIPHIV